MEDHRLSFTSGNSQIAISYLPPLYSVWTIEWEQSMRMYSERLDHSNLVFQKKAKESSEEIAHGIARMAENQESYRRSQHQIQRTEIAARTTEQLRGRLFAIEDKLTSFNLRLAVSENPREVAALEKEISTLLEKKRELEIEMGRYEIPIASTLSIEGSRKRPISAVDGTSSSSDIEDTFTTPSRHAD